MNKDTSMDEKISRLLRCIDIDVPAALDGRIRTAAANLRQYQGHSSGSRHKVLLTCLGVSLIAAVFVSIWVLVKHANTASVSGFEAISRTLSLVTGPSNLPSDFQSATGVSQEESSDDFFSHGLLRIVQDSSYHSQSKVYNIAPLFTPEDISKLLINDRVIEKTLKLIRGNDKEV